MVAIGLAVGRDMGQLRPVALVGERIENPPCEVLAVLEGNHLVICDLLMPDVDGFAVVRALKDDARTSEVPVLILTGHELDERERRRLHGRIVGTVEKGDGAMKGLRAWLATVLSTPPEPGSIGASG